MAARGAPLGNRNATENRPWADAIRRAILANNGKRLRSIAEQLLRKADEGDIQAIKEIGDRLDGKPAQAITGAGGGAVKAVVEVVFVHAKPKG